MNKALLERAREIAGLYFAKNGPLFFMRGFDDILTLVKETREATIRECAEGFRNMDPTIHEKILSLLSNEVKENK